MGPLAALACQGTPFFFITDFLGKCIECYPVETLAEHDIVFDFSQTPTPSHREPLVYDALPFSRYAEKFHRVIEAVKRGETYVLNLTQPTSIQNAYTLKEIYDKAHARFKVRYKNRFVCFSPEPFIRIEGNTIHTYPMKGTIDAAIEDAQTRLLNDPKELAEHVMIVDLLRNDLSQIATEVRVEAFRYIEAIRAGDKTLLHASSHITGKLSPNWKAHLDDLIAALLPAGSISGAPKRSTVAHILEIEGYDRGFFTGIMGYFDGETLSTAVMIRFIEQTPQGLVYKSGGGITLDSRAESEYQEMLHKIYIP